MKRSRVTEAQIIGVIKEHEAGEKTDDLLGNQGVSKPMATITKPPSTCRRGR